MAQALTMFRAVGDRHAISIALNHLVPTLIKLERYEEAKSYLWESIALCGETKDRWGKGTTYRFLGLTALAEEQYMDAQVHFRTSLEIFGEYIVGWDIARSLVYLGDALLLSGSLPESRETYMQALHVAKEAKSIPLVLDALAALSDFHFKTGQMEHAFELASLVLNHDSSTKDVKDRACWIRAEASKCLDREQIRMLEEKMSQQSFEAIVNAPH
jgi:tetratricopeptide (TPR) repeat protein